jgi:putative membrane protein
VNGVADSTELQAERRKENEMVRLLSLMGVVIMASFAPASGQPTAVSPPAPGNPAGMPPGTTQSPPGSPAPRQTNQSDRVFIHAAAVGGLAEVDLGNLAMQKAAGRAVKDFAQLMVRDHGAANDRLAAIAKESGITLPDQLDEEHRTMRSQLEQSRGPRFDHAYIQGQIIDHQKTAQLLEYEIGSGENMDLKAFASDTLPTILEHLRMAQAITAGMSQQTEGLSRDKDQQRH